MYVVRWLLLAGIALPCACLEMPVTRISHTEGPVVTADASDDAATGPQAACLACMAAPDEPGPGCETKFLACKQDPKCSVIIDCGFERQCFQGSRRAFLGCGLPCVTSGGVLTGDDPILILASNLFQCLANGPCGNLCFSSE
jgi:hypothetical protein